MNKVSKIIKDNLNFIIFSLYLLIVWYVYLYVNYYGILNDMETNKKVFVWLLFGFFVLIVVSSKIMMRVVDKVDISFHCGSTTRKKVICFLIVAVITFLILLIWFFAYYPFYPDTFAPDCADQYRQAMSGEYSDWHPVWHTILFYAIPLKLTGADASVVMTQIIFMSLVMGYLASSMCEYVSIKTIFAIVGYIMLNPRTGRMIMHPYKDMAFALAIFLAMICVAKNYFSGNVWIKRPGRAVILGIILANATLFRHNGILFTFFLMMAMFFNVERRKALQIVMAFIVFMFVVKVPLYSALNVTKPDQRKTETMGLPLTIIANVAKETPQKLNKQTFDFINSIASHDYLVENYECGNFNSIKFNGLDLSVVEETSTFDLLKMTARCFKVSPEASFKALFCLTDMVYSAEGELEGDNRPIPSKIGNNSLSCFTNWYTKIMYGTVFKYITYIGTSMIFMLVFMLCKSNLFSWEHWKRLFLCLPIFTYNFGTMLLLTGPDARFFYVSYLVCPIVILIMLFKKGEPKDE